MHGAERTVVQVHPSCRYQAPGIMYGAVHPLSCDRRVPAAHAQLLRAAFSELTVDDDDDD